MSQEMSYSNHLVTSIRATLFSPRKGVCTSQNVYFSLCRSLTIFPTVLHRSRWLLCSVAEQHANTQSFICKADCYMIPFHFSHGLGSWFSYPLQRCKNGKYELNLLYSSPLQYSKIMFQLLCHLLYF